VKIDGFHIDGYGVHHDLGISDLPGGLTIVAGPNEAGKTTLQHFLVGMLFGFTASNRPDHHAPLRGGTYGGRLFLSDADGRQLTVHRGARRSSLRITGPDGPVEDSELADLLGGATKDLYQSIFAVHIDELAELRALSDEQVRDRVFSAGIIGAGRTAQAALTELVTERDALLKPGGRSPDKYRIKRLRGELVEARSLLADAQRTAKGLPALTHRIGVLERDRTQVRTERQSVQAQRALLAAVADLWPAWAEAAEARSQLDQLGAVPAIAADAGVRLDRAVARAEDLANVRRDAAEALTAATEQLDAISPVGPALAHRAAITDLVAAAPVERERLAAATEQHARAQHLTRDLAATLAELGPECDEAWLAERPERAEAAVELRATAADVASAEQQRAHLADLHRRTAAELADARAELAATHATLEAAPSHPLDRAQKAVEDAAVLVSLVGQREAAARRLSAAQQPAPAPPAPSVPAFLVPTLLVLGAVLLLAGGAGLATGAPIIGGLAVAAGALLGGVGFAVRRSLAAHAAPVAATADHAELIAAELAELDHDLAPVLAALGLSTAPTLAEATNLRTRAEHLAGEAAHLERERAQVVQRTQVLAERTDRHHHRSTAELAQAQAQIDATRDAWDRWLHTQGMPATLDATGAAQVLDALTRARSLQRSLATTRADHQRAVDQHQTYRQRLQELLRTTIQRAERDLATVVGAVPERLDEARTLLAQADPTRWADQLRILAVALRDADDRIDDLTTELAHLAREREQLERSADVPTCELRVTDLEAQLVEAVSRWAALTVAHQLVEGTLARYQRERQPDVVKRAAARFSQITGGRYPRLEVRDQEIVAIDHAEREVPAPALSLGAKEQLYLCMRFALAESYAKTTKLPLLLDDITVNADDLDTNAEGNRLRRLAETIASVATEQQVLVFTHQQATVDLLRAAAPQARLIELQASSGTRRMGLAAG
jgi:uncharacterized protein YhaN